MSYSETMLYGDLQLRCCIMHTHLIFMWTRDQKVLCTSVVLKVTSVFPNQHYKLNTFVSEVLSTPQSKTAAQNSLAHLQNAQSKKFTPFAVDKNDHILDAWSWWSCLNDAGCSKETMGCAANRHGLGSSRYRFDNRYQCFAPMAPFEYSWSWEDRTVNEEDGTVRQ